MTLYSANSKKNYVTARGAKYFYLSTNFIFEASDEKKCWVSEFRFKLKLRDDTKTVVSCSRKPTLRFGFSKYTTKLSRQGTLTKGGSITVQLTCFANINKNGQLSYSWFQTSQTGGQQYSDTSPFSVPWSRYEMVSSLELTCSVIFS